MRSPYLRSANGCGFRSDNSTGFLRSSCARVPCSIIGISVSTEHGALSRKQTCDYQRLRSLRVSQIRGISAALIAKDLGSLQGRIGSREEYRSNFGLGRCTAKTDRTVADGSAAELRWPNKPLQWLITHSCVEARA